MSKLDITVGGLYVSKLINVIKSRNRNHHKLLNVNCRHSDAFVYILSGSCSYKFDDGTEFSVNGGDFIYLPHNAKYTMFIHDDNYRFMFCDFKFDSAEPRQSFAFTPKNPSQTENLFIRLLNLHSSRTPSARAEAVATLYSIYGSVIAARNETYIAGTLKERIRHAKEHIDSNFGDDSLNVARLAEMADISEVYFRKLFKIEYGCSPSQYILSERLKNAKIFLRYPFLTVEECAAKSGFSSVQYFCRVFKKELGVTPSKYRKRL